MKKVKEIKRKRAVKRSSKRPVKKKAMPARRETKWFKGKRWKTAKQELIKRKRCLTAGKVNGLKESSTRRWKK